MFQDQYVDLAAYTELRQINPRFHRTAGMWEQDALVLCLKVIQVGPVAMFVGGDAMAGPMDKVISITCPGDHPPDDIIDLPPFDGSIGCQTFPHKSDAGISRPAHNLEDVTLALRNLVASSGEGYPGIVSVDGTRAWQMRPEVEEYQIATLNGTVCCARRLVVRVAAMCIGSHNSCFRHQSGLLNHTNKALLHAIFVQFSAITQVLAELCKEAVLHGNQSPSSF